MALVPDTGVNQLAFSGTVSWATWMAATDPVVRLYSNDLSATLDKDRVVADFMEAVFTGYAPINLAVPTYVSAPMPGPTHKGTLIFGGGYLWEYSSLVGQNIFGYYITFTDDASQARVWAFEQFSAFIPIFNIGDFIALELRMDCISP